MKKLTLLAVWVLAMSLYACAQPGEGQVQHLDKAEFFKKVANYERDSVWHYLGDKPAIVDFYATWCGPCRQIAPFLEELAKTYKKEIYVYKIDVDKEPELASAFNVQSIPTLIFIPMKDSPQIAKGAMPKETIEEAIKTVLLKKEKK